MADYIVKDTELTSVANAIRTAGGTNSLLSFPNGFVSAVGNISGGGSSDFSTAQVTIDVGEGFSGEGIIAFDFETAVDYLINDEYDGYQYAYSARLSIGDTLSQNPPELSSTNTITLLLYSGQCDFYLPIDGVTTMRSFVKGVTENVSVAGNATLDTENAKVIITGDCTITVNNWVMQD